MNGTSLELKGKSIVTTCLDDDQEIKVKRIAENLGAVVKSAVSGKTDILVVSDTALRETVKYRKAKELIAAGKAITVIGYAEFLKKTQPSEPDFVIVNSVLTKYNGPGGDMTVPDGVTIIGKEAFEYCKSLTSVTLPEGVTSIGDYAFNGCASLTSVTLPKSLTNIGKRAFLGCRSLTSITLPDSVTSIGEEAFYFCTNLTSITLPKGIWSIGERAFYFCWNLTLQVSRWLPYYTALYKSGLVGPRVRPSVITIVPPSLRRTALLGFVSEEISEPESERSKSYLDFAKRNAGKLCSFAFDNPKLLYYLCENKLINPGDVDVYVEEAGKRGDVELKALILNYQNSLGMENVFKAREEKEKKKEEYEDAFIERMMKRDPSQGIEGMTFVVSCISWVPQRVIKIYLEKYGAKLGSSVTKKTDYLVTNDTDSGSEKTRKAAELGVGIITEEKFRNMLGLRYMDAERIEIPGWFKEIPTCTFENCRKLKEIVISNGVTTIGSGAFSGCTSLGSIALPKSVTSIGDRAFYNCKSLISVTLPDGVTSIGKETFQYCESLTCITMPEGVTSIGDGAFRGCKSLKSVTLPESLTSIGDHAFWGSKSLTSITLPEGLKSIGNFAFAGCKSLRSIILPDGVTSIGDSAFLGCQGLWGITIRAPAGSYAERYAKEHSIYFKAL
ncbi:MAG: leucine-rich repeat protein [Clostridia bacterium]|nr:leucine-rich repeat protein [Clostridia bacterium]